MSRLTYRDATVADLPFIVRLAMAEYIVPADDDPEAADPAYARALAAIDADPNQQLFIAELDGEPVATFQLTYTPGIMRRGATRATIEAVFVAPEQRNMGLGAEMVLWAVERARERGCAVVQLTSNKARLDAHRFYRRLGFEQSHEGFKLYL